MFHLGHDIPAGLYVLHKCDNPPCCNPAHLFLGDQKANAADMKAKGRAHIRTPGYRISDAEVHEMAATGLSLSALASRYRRGNDSIRAAFARVGLPLATRATHRVISRDDLLRYLALDCQSLSEMGRRTGIYRMLLRRAFRREGLDYPVGTGGRTNNITKPTKGA
ncbi:HNH endonuclease [Brevundimonas nasdae]|uniref:HNH endonuclease n=1 Tax=Brevundimonas nasdae TaxID=172043 RepID=UPI003977E290